MASSDTDYTTVQDLRRASLKWLEHFFLLLFVTLTVWYLFRWWALIPGIVALLILVRTVSTAKMANMLDEHR